MNDKLQDIRDKYKPAIGLKWSAENFIENEWSVEKVLLDCSHFCAFTGEMSHLKLTNASGSSYRDHCKAVYKDGVLLIDYHNTNNYCDIKIASDPNAIFSSGCQNSAAYGDPHPKLEGGEWIKVWDGKILKDGPWWAKINGVIQYWINKGNEKSKKILIQYGEYLVELEKSKQVDDSELIKNWSCE